jgi:hypothetical protein
LAVGAILSSFRESPSIAALEIRCLEGLFVHQTIRPVPSGTLRVRFLETGKQPQPIRSSKLGWFSGIVPYDHPKSSHHFGSGRHVHRANNGQWLVEPQNGVLGSTTGSAQA